MKVVMMIIMILTKTNIYKIIEEEVVKEREDSFQMMACKVNRLKWGILEMLTLMVKNMDHLIFLIVNIWATGNKTVDQAVQCSIKVKLIHKPMFKTN